jgi:hypothetical protein
MSDTSITPNIEVTIGRQTRLYHAFVTTGLPPSTHRPRSRSTPVRSRTSRALPWNPPRLTQSDPRRHHGWFSSTPRNSGGSARATDRERINSRQQIPFWLASILCSSGCGSGCRSRWRECTHASESDIRSGGGVSCRSQHHQEPSVTSRR